MIIKGLILYSYGAFGGGAFGNLLARWEAAGVFSFVLPFLLIFAIVFAILAFIPIFKDNKGINAVISLATALMSLQFGLVPRFFSEIFPKLGVALSIVLVLIILLGMLIRDNEKGNQVIKWIMAIFLIIIALVVVFSSLNVFAFGGGAFWSSIRYNFGDILISLLVIGGIVAIIASQKPKSKIEAPIGISPLFGKGQ